jgi:DNA-directed RNA polymerase specialized sigma24 family protein
MNARIFLGELKQRNVYKVGIAYAVAAWLLMQVASQIFPFFEIPSWVVRLVVLLLIIGFPVALVLAWAFELTPEGIKRAEDVGLSKSSAPKSRNLTVPDGGVQKRAAFFSTTHWSVVLEAQGLTPEAQAAMDNLCRTYWRPAYGFVRQQRVGPEEAKDFTQGFFALLLERRDLDTVRKEKGRLRSYLLRSLKHFLANERYRTMAIKRGKGHNLIPLDALRDHDHVDLAQVDNLTPDQIYERRWALTVLDQVLARLGDEYRAAGPAAAELFDRLQKSLTDEPDRPSPADLARRFGMTETAAKEAFRRLRRHYRQLLREEIGQTVTGPGDIEDELRHLIAVLRAYPKNLRGNTAVNPRPWVGLTNSVSHF